MDSKVSGIIVSHNPDLTRFRDVLNSLINETDHIIVVDNASSNINGIAELCRKIPNCDLIRLNFNSGIAYALMKGVHYAVNNYRPDWLLFLDDDTIVLKGAINKALQTYENLPTLVRNKVGLIKLGSWDGDCGIYNIFYEAFSGTLIKSEIAVKACCRINFFLDQADHDLYVKVRELGYLTLRINCKLIDHELGNKIWSPILSRIHRKNFVYYEPPWRYYYIARNATILFKERKMHSRIYLSQLLYWGLNVLFRDGFRKFLRPLGLGILHALLNQEGYVDKKHF